MKLELNLCLVDRWFTRATRSAMVVAGSGMCHVCYGERLSEDLGLLMLPKVVETSLQLSGSELNSASATLPSASAVWSLISTAQQFATFNKHARERKGATEAPRETFDVTLPRTFALNVCSKTLKLEGNCVLHWLHPARFALKPGGWELALGEVSMTAKLQASRLFPTFGLLNLSGTRMGLPQLHHDKVPTDMVCSCCSI